MRLRRFLYHSYIYVVLLLLFALNFCRSVVYAKSYGGSLSTLFLISIGGGSVYGYLDIVTLIFYLTPYLLALYFYADFMRADFLISSVYLFTRINKKERWLFHSFLRLAAQIFALFFLIEIAGFIVGIGFGLKPEEPVRLVYMLLSIGLLNALSMLCCVFFESFISLRCGCAAAFSITATLYLFLFFFSAVAGTGLLPRLSLPENQIYAAHSDRITAGSGTLTLTAPLDNFPVIFSITFFLIIIAALYLIFRTILVKRDLFELVKEV